jgi:hypothetical protein
MVCYNSLLVLFLQQKGITVCCRGTLAFNAMFGTTTCKTKTLFLKQKSLLLPWEKNSEFHSLPLPCAFYIKKKQNRCCLGENQELFSLNLGGLTLVHRSSSHIHNSFFHRNCVQKIASFYVAKLN